MLSTVNFTYAASNTNNVSESLDTLDILAAAAFVLNGETTGRQSLIEDDTHLKEIIPLYNNLNEVIAFYVSFFPYGYAVINNSKANPAAIEFGSTDNTFIRDILESDADPHILYANPVSVVNAAPDSELNILNSSINNYNLYNYYPDLAEPDDELAALVKQSKYVLAQQPMPIGDGDYGFINIDDLPGGKPTRCKQLDGIEKFNWANMSDYDSFANNHCGATAVTNLALYFGTYGYPKLLKILKPSGSWDLIKSATFIEVHKCVGNGKVTAHNFIRPLSVQHG